METVKFIVICLTLLMLNQAASGGQSDDVERENNAVWDLSTKQPIRHAQSRLTRDQDGACISIDTRNLPEGAYTVWWVLYNEPALCNNPVPYAGASCGDLDIANPGVRATVMQATGELVGPDGKAHISACIKKGELTRSVFDIGTMEGLTNPPGAEIQVIIRYHGPGHYNDPSILGEQLTRYQGGCEDYGGAAAPPSCEDKQQIVHTAPSGQNEHRD